MIKRTKIRSNQIGIVYRNGEVRDVLTKGQSKILLPFSPNRVELYDTRESCLVHGDLRTLYRSGKLEDHLHFLDLQDHQRALLWLDNRFEGILGTGLHGVWKTPAAVRIEVVDIGNPRFEHESLTAILKRRESHDHLNPFSVEEGHEGLFFHNGGFREKLPPGQYAFWKESGRVKLYNKDLRDRVLEVSGQDIMTADNVTLRLSAVLTYRCTDTLKAVLNLDNPEEAIYREVQLAMRSAVGAKELDAVMKEKGALSQELAAAAESVLAPYGLKVRRLGVRDIILPGDMKEILNKVVEAKKKSEAVLICKREETAAMRSRANTAKMLENNPTLLRLRELEIIEQAVRKGSFNFVLGDQSISEALMNTL